MKLNIHISYKLDSVLTSSINCSLKKLCNTVLFTNTFRGTETSEGLIHSVPSATDLKKYLLSPRPYIFPRTFLNFLELQMTLVMHFLAITLFHCRLKLLDPLAPQPATVVRSQEDYIAAMGRPLSISLYNIADSFLHLPPASDTLLREDEL
jgi:hypothetical protein